MAAEANQTQNRRRCEAPGGHQILQSGMCSLFLYQIRSNKGLAPSVSGPLFELLFFLFASFANPFE